MNSGNPLQFTMVGARKASESGLAHIQQQIETLEEAIRKNNPGLVFDMARSLLESVCKAILKEKGVPYKTDWSLSKFVKEVLDQLVLVSSDVADGDKASNSLRKISGSLSAVAQGLMELRNDFGFASHGKGPEFQGLDMVHALFVARSTDTIIEFLHTLHRISFSEPSPPLDYGTYPEFNDYIDEQNMPVRIVMGEDSLEYSPSEVLYNVDRQAYEYYLGSFLESEEDKVEPHD